MFENIECEWPMFFCYLIIDALFVGDKEAASEYIERLEEVITNSLTDPLLILMS